MIVIFNDPKSEGDVAKVLESDRRSEVEKVGDTFKSGENLAGIWGKSKASFGPVDEGEVGSNLAGRAAAKGQEQRGKFNQIKAIIFGGGSGGDREDNFGIIGTNGGIDRSGDSNWFKVRG